MPGRNTENFCSLCSLCGGDLLTEAYVEGRNEGEGLFEFDVIMRLICWQAQYIWRNARIWIDNFIC